jgi:murein DD-endopeptidase MepM/ murein hydrolase activator NlpD
MFTIQRPVKRDINQHFGDHPENYMPYGFAGHEGVDFLCPPGDPVHCCADGIVVEVDSHGNYGLHITIGHQVIDDRGVEWQVTTIYAHLSKSFVWNGKKVIAGELIALSGNTGHSGGPHLHLTMKVEGMNTAGYPAGIVDPEPFFEKGV